MNGYVIENVADGMFYRSRADDKPMFGTLEWATRYASKGRASEVCREWGRTVSAKDRRGAYRVRYVGPDGEVQP